MVNGFLYRAVFGVDIGGLLGLLTRFECLLMRIGLRWIIACCDFTSLPLQLIH